MKQIIFFLSLMILSIFSFAQSWQYPPTKTVDGADTYFGVTYPDPYRWLENMKDPEVTDWFKKQAEFTDAVLNNLSGRNELLNEIKELDKMQPPEIGMERNFQGGRLFYTKRMPGEPVAKFYCRQGINGKEVLLFDPTTFIKGKLLSIQRTIPSHDGKKVLISYTESGAEVGSIRILDVDKKAFLPEIIFPSWFGPLSWTFDNKAFTYCWQHTADNTDPTFELNTKTKLHVLGDDVKNDKDFFSNESYPELNIQPNEFPLAMVTTDSRNYVFGNVANVRQENNLFFAPINQLNGRIEWKVLCKPGDQLIKEIVFKDDDAYAITYKNAHNYQLIHTTLKNPDWDNAEIIIPEKSDQTLENIIRSKNYLIATYSDGIYNYVYKYDFRTKELSPVKLPYPGTAFVFCMDNKTDSCSILITSWNKPPTEFDVDLSTNKFSASLLNKPPNYPAKYTNMEVKEVEVKGHDGVLIPLSILYKKGLALNGQNVCILESYGAYGISMPPYFDLFFSSMIQKGVVVAIPHVRGGSEKGQQWYKGGFKTTKPNTWKDFNSCAEYLISEGYTSAGKIGGSGTSAGGILISRAITEKPELYGSAVCNVGMANAMRAEFTPNGPGNIPEFGTVADSIECRALFEMDGLQHVVKGTSYPALLSVAGWNDPRVVPWQLGKFAAAIQNANISGKPALLKVNYNSGHFTEDRNETYSNFADQYAFLLWQCGHPEFQIR